MAQVNQHPQDKLSYRFTDEGAILTTKQLGYGALRQGYEAEMRRVGRADGDWDLDDGLLEIHRFVERLRKTEGFPYIWRTNTERWESSSRFPEVARFGRGPSEQFLARFDVSPQIAAFTQLCAMHRVPDLFWVKPNAVAIRGPGDRLVCAELFNLVVDGIRKRSTLPQPQRRYLNRRSSVLSDCDSAVSLVREVSQRTRRLSIARTELMYSTEDRLKLTPAQVKKDLGRLFNNWRKHWSDTALSGYFWKLQYGTKSGYHVHLITMWNAREIPDLSSVRAELDHLWKSVASLRSETRSPRADCPVLGAGSGLWEDKKAARAELLRGMLYLLQKDQYFRIRTGPRQRTFGRSELTS